MLAPTRASEEYEAQKRLTVATLAATRRQWARMGSDWDSSFATVAPRLAAILAAAQLGSARQGAAYVPEVLDEQGMAPEPVARVRPESLAGYAADGRTLESLVSLTLLRSKVGGSLDTGARFLDMVVETEIADAHRASIQLATIARPRTGYIRMVNTPCCKDCALQAGKWFKANAGFDRHPNCKCFHLPSTDPESDYARYPEPHEITGITDAERKALEAGGDYSQVLNAGRGRSVSERRSKMTTLEGTTKHGWFGGGYSKAGRQEITSADAARRQGAVKSYRTRRTDARMTPDGIYRVASDEAEAIRLLTRYGYLG